MPQMAPLNWLFLFLMFTITFMIFNSMNYFSMMYSFKIKKFLKSKKLLNWKW
uniref:ATP synthase complex subunit 8 n=1 Tax=Aleochara postica TaxID=2822418 RepID=A0A8A5RA85_9COLE|nr:ATP synthase F0 subunit 8 [Aleochara postica]QTG39873.1 ATP synthase F0 subunit 8 [Aleochara postica]